MYNNWRDLTEREKRRVLKWKMRKLKKQNPKLSLDIIKDMAGVALQTTYFLAWTDVVVYRKYSAKKEKWIFKEMNIFKLKQQEVQYDG